MTTRPPDDLELLRQVEEDLTTLEDITRRRPLTVWRAWHQDPPATSQRAIIQLVLATKELVVLGGVRSGKTAVLMAITTALVLGSDHPDARAFWFAHGIDPDELPQGPSRAWVIARTSHDSQRYHRKPYLALIPKWGPVHPLSTGRPANWRSWNLMGTAESHIEIMCPGYDDPAEIHFKSEDQGQDSFDGDHVRIAHHDEEGKTERVYKHVKYRLIDDDGWQLFSNAPVKQQVKTWVYYRFELQKPKGATIRRLHSVDNPYLPPARVKEIADDPVFGRGEFVIAKGRIWPQFNRHDHVLPAAVRDQIPRDAPRFRTIDFGTRHPHCCLWFAALRSALALPDGRVLPDKSYVLYREHYVAEQTLAWHVARYREYEGWVRDRSAPRGWRRVDATERIAETWADPEDPQQILSLCDDHGIDCVKAQKAFHAGVEAVADLLAKDGTGYPKLFILEDCENTIREVENYVWKDVTDAEGVAPERPSGQSDHACDDLRYFAMGIKNYF